MSDQDWKDIELFVKGDHYFDALLVAIDGAERSIDLEIYIYENDEIGKQITAKLKAAAAREVRVRVMVDSVGSMNSKSELQREFAESGVEFAVFHPLPYEHLSFVSDIESKRARLFHGLLARFYRRTHRKVFVIDDQAWVGGINIWSVHSERINGDQAWRDYAVRVRGLGVAAILASMRLLWPSLNKAEQRECELKLLEWVDQQSDPVVLLNHHRLQRRRRNRYFVNKIKSASSRVRIVTAYFIPTPKLIVAMIKVVRRGVDIEVMVPDRADIRFIPFAMRLLSAPLLKAGVRIFQYKPAMLHAKSVIIDQWATVGSSNLNYRSLYHDLEIDIVITDPKIQEQLLHQYQLYRQECRELKFTDLGKRPLFERIVGRIALLIKGQL